MMRILVAVFSFFVVASAAATIRKATDVQAVPPFPGVVNCAKGIGCCLPSEFDPASPDHMPHLLNSNHIFKRAVTTVISYTTVYRSTVVTDTIAITVTQPVVTTSIVHVAITQTVTTDHTVFVTATSNAVVTSTSTITEIVRRALAQPTPSPVKSDPILGYLDSWD